MSERLGWRQGISDKHRARQVEALVRRTVEEWGGLDAMVNNAGLGVAASTPVTTEEDCERVSKRSTGCRSNRSAISSIRWCACNWEGSSGLGNRRYVAASSGWAADRSARNTDARRQSRGGNVRGIGSGGGDGLGGDHHGVCRRHPGGTPTARGDGVPTERERRGRPFVRNPTRRTRLRPAGRLFRALGPRVNRCPIAGEPTVVPAAEPRVGSSGD